MRTSAKKEAVNHPAHYKAGGLEAIDVIEAFGLGFRLGNAVKYILRAGRKGAAAEDLKKSAWYLDREIAKCAAEDAAAKRKSDAADKGLRAEVGRLRAWEADLKEEADRLRADRINLTVERAAAAETQARLHGEIRAKLEALGAAKRPRQEAGST